MLSMSSKNAEQEKFMVMVKITDTCHFHKSNANIIIILMVVRYWLLPQPLQRDKALCDISYWFERLENELKIPVEEKH